MTPRAQHVGEHEEQPLVVVDEEHARRPFRVDGLGGLLRGRDDLEPARVQPQAHRGALALAAVDAERAAVALDDIGHLGEPAPGPAW